MAKATKKKDNKPKKEGANEYDVNQPLMLLLQKCSGGKKNKEEKKSK